MTKSLLKGKVPIYVGLRFAPFLNSLHSALDDQMEVEKAYIRLCSVVGSIKGANIMHEIKSKSKEQLRPNHIYIIEELNKAYFEIVVEK
jgi:hypothetical protein